MADVTSHAGADAAVFGLPLQITTQGNRNMSDDDDDIPEFEPPKAVDPQVQQQRDKAREEHLRTLAKVPWCIRFEGDGVSETVYGQMAGPDACPDAWEREGWPRLPDNFIDAGRLITGLGQFDYRFTKLWAHIQADCDDVDEEDLRNYMQAAAKPDDRLFDPYDELIPLLARYGFDAEGNPKNGPLRWPVGLPLPEGAGAA